MGSLRTYTCSKCDYEVESCGDLDHGMMAVLRPHICNDCKIVTDVEVGEMGMEIDKKMLDILEKDDKDRYYKCEKCDGENITVWNPKLRNCPKCSGYMEVDPSKPIIMWD